MKPEAREIQIFLRGGCIQAGQNVSKFGHVLRQNTAWIIFAVEPLQTLVPERFNHKLS